jgi:outer membrane protein TolC
VLVNRERLKLLDANLLKLKKMLEDVGAMNKAGFVEKIDVDRLEVAYNNLITEKDKVVRLMGISETLLKFQMGYKVNEAILLTDSLSASNNNVITITENQKTEYSLRPEYALVQTQQKLNELNLKRFKLGYLPSLAAYGVLSEQAQRDKFNFFDASQKWYPIGIVGATLNISFFDGLQNVNRIQQAKINILKTKNTMTGLEQAIDMEISIAQVSYKNALNSLESQTKNMKLAQDVLTVANKKYEQGVGSNLEVINAQTSLKEAETNYFNALYDVYVSKIDYLKANGSLVK